MTRTELLEVAKPISFSTEMVRAILDGRKTVTRRIIKPQPTEGVSGYWHLTKGGHHFVLQGLIGERRDGSNMYPYGVEQFMEMHTLYQAGDYLYVRETWCGWYLPYGKWLYRYKATDPNGNRSPTGPEYDDEWEVRSWHPSIHMPKEAARIFLRVIEVRVERLQDISPGQCVAEGVEREALTVGDEFVRGIFSRIWDGLRGKKDLPFLGWEANPWVWVIHFERVEANRNG